LRNPGFFEIVCGSVLSLVLGVVAAATILIFKPVEVLETVSSTKELDPAKIYFFQGRRDSNAGQRWRFKKDSLLQGHTVRFNEDELNTWIENVYPKQSIEYKMAAKFRAQARAKETGKPIPPDTNDKSGEETPEFGSIKVGTPNFRITGDTLRIGVFYYFTIFDETFVVVAQADGAFAKGKDEEVYSFVPNTLYLGSLPVHKLFTLPQLVQKQLLNTFELPEDLVEAWANIKDVKLVQRELLLQGPSQ
jgi:hypothetical protein